jgi:membrane-bound metal-dependent hydrolase YbcI (DUF457 family)
VYAGHIGVALGAKGVSPRQSLALLIFATQLPDWIDGTLCVVDCRFGPYEMYSHSFPAIAIVALLIGGLYFLFTRNRPGAAMMGAMVVSHALTDYITGDKPTWPGGPRLGLQIYSHPVLDFAVEAAVVLAGWLIYRKSLTEEQRSKPPVWAILLALLALQVYADAVVIANRIPKC